MESKIIVVSGGSKGLGKGIVLKLLEENHKVAAFSRSSSSFIEKCQNEHATNFLWESVNAEDFNQIKSYTKTVFKKFGTIDVLINNAGVGIDGLMTLMSDKNIHKGITINLEGTIHLTKACLKIMLLNQSGSIINISSVNAIRGHAGVSVYSATKSALDGLTRSLAREVGPEGIRVNSLAPGYFLSDMSEKLSKEQQNRIIKRTPLRRLGTVSDMVSMIYFLISDQASFITGQTFIIDGGLTC